MGGGQIGVNYQFSSGVVVGVEAMFDWLPGSQLSPVSATDPTGTISADITNVSERWLATATGRLGYSWDRVLFYAKGGGAWVTASNPAISVGGAPATFASVSNTNSFGYTAGFGLEWAFLSNWSVRAEYDYIGLPDQSYTVAAGTPTFGDDVIAFNNRSISIMTVAVNYNSAAGEEGDLFPRLVRCHYFIRTGIGVFARNTGRASAASLRCRRKSERSRS